MQEVQNTTANYISSDSTQTKAQQNGNHALFQSLLNNTPSPKDISFEEYQDLSYENIETLFQGTEAIAEAMALKDKTNWSNDKTFNTILFNMQLDDINNGTNNTQTYIQAQFLSHHKMDDVKISDIVVQEMPKEMIESRKQMEDPSETLNFLANIESYIEQNSDKEWAKNLDKEKIISISTYVVEQYRSKTNENNAALSSYTRTNTTTPTNSTINETSETETTPKYEKMFQRIIEDGYVSYDEVEYFTYEQAKAFPEYLMQKDEDGEFIKSTLIDMDRKTGMLLSGAALNKAIFHSVRKIEDEQTLETFMYDMTGTQLSDKIFAYPELQNVDYAEHGGFSQFIAKKTAEYQVKLDNASNEEEKEEYQAMVGAFTRLDHMNKSFNNQSIHDNSDPFEKLRALVADIVSMFKTGFTVEELEHIEELLKQIREKIKEYKENGNPK